MMTSASQQIEFEYASFEKIDAVQKWKSNHPLNCFEHLVHGYVRINKARDPKFPTSVLGIIEYFYPGYCIYHKSSHHSDDTNEFEILSDISSVCDDPNNIYGPLNGNWGFHLKTLTNKIYARSRRGEIEFKAINLITPSNDLILHKTRRMIIIMDKQNKTCGIIPSGVPWCVPLKTLRTMQDSTDKHNLPEFSNRNIYKIRKIADCGRDLDLLLMDDGSLWYKRNEQKEYQLFPDFDVNIIEMVCGTYGSTLLLDDNHNLWVYGEAQCGILGIDMECDDISNRQIINKPIRNRFFDDKKVSKIYVSETHSCVILENGDCYFMGANVYGQCGNDDRENIKMEFADDTFDFQIADLDHLMISKPYLFQTKYPHLKIKQAALGKNHTILLTEDNEIYGFGYNKNNEIMDHKLPIIITPSLIDPKTIGLQMSNERIFKIFIDGPYDEFTIITSKCFSKE